MMVFENDDIQILHRVGNSDFVLVTFSSLGMFNSAGSLADGNTYWAKALADKFDYNAFGFVAKRKDWFCSAGMVQACRIVRDLANDRQIIVYGSSMGGYGAIRWAAALGASGVVAFAPQSSIEPAVVGSFDTRYARYFLADIHHNMGITGGQAGCPTYIFYDPYEPIDRIHVERISDRILAPRRVALKFCGHECIRAFGSDAADRILRLCAADDQDGVNILAEVQRKKSVIRAFELAKRLLPKKPSIAANLLEKYESKFEVGQRAQLNAKFPTRASALTQESLNVVDGTFERVDGGFLESRKEKSKVMVAERRIVHLHIPKTAGTALKAAFQTRFGGSLRVFPEWDEKSLETVEKENFDFFSGHIGFTTARRLDGDIVTVLRHPVDRFLSGYYFWRQLYESGVEKSLNTELAFKFNIQDFVTLQDQPSLIEEFQNRCTFQLAHGSSQRHRRELRLSGLNDDGVFNMATENLRKIAVLGLQENIDSFSRRLKARFEIDLNIREVNVTRVRSTVADTSIDVRKAIHKWVYLDIELY